MTDLVNKFPHHPISQLGRKKLRVCEWIVASHFLGRPASHSGNPFRIVVDLWVPSSFTYFLYYFQPTGSKEGIRGGFNLYILCYIPICLFVPNSSSQLDLLCELWLPLNTLISSFLPLPAICQNLFEKQDLLFIPLFHLLHSLGIEVRSQCVKYLFKIDDKLTRREGLFSEGSEGRDPCRKEIYPVI